MSTAPTPLAAKRDYTVLVCMRGPTPGKVSAVQEGDGMWGRREVPPNFRRVSFRATPLGVQWLIEHCRYDPKSEQFVHTDTGDLFDEDVDVIENQEFDKSPERVAEFARLLNGGHDPDGDPCLFMRPHYLTDDAGDGRKYCIRLLYPYRRRTGVKRLLRAVKRGMHLDLREQFLALPPAVRAQILQEAPTQDRRYLRWLCLRGDR